MVASATARESLHGGCLPETHELSRGVLPRSNRKGHGSSGLQPAIAHFTEAIRLNPAYAEAHKNLGAALGAQGKIEEAIGHFAEAVRLKPGFTEARDNLLKAQATRSQAKGTR
jgi:cytochrome c-type biogenesis protein CcmH/NrfG